jgi:hypothetical protein
MKNVAFTVADWSSGVDGLTATTADTGRTCSL